MLYPLKFKPIFKERIWGGRKLETMFHKNLPAGLNIGESWELSGMEGDESVVENGPLAGKTLNEVLAEYKGELVGEAVYAKYGNHFPLLIKFLDAQDDLSIQVHPNDKIAKEKHNSYGKTEMWYVVDAEPGAQIVLGFNKPMNPTLLRESILNKTLEEHLNYVPVKKGDAFFIPAGLVHAIGKGIVIAEIQQASDITYRLYDYNRVDKNGNERELHVEDGIGAVDYGVDSDFLLQYKTFNVHHKPFLCEYFQISCLSLDNTDKSDNTNTGLSSLYVCFGSDVNLYIENIKYIVNSGDIFFLPSHQRNMYFDLTKNSVVLKVLFK